MIEFEGIKLYNILEMEVTMANIGDIEKIHCKKCKLITTHVFRFYTCGRHWYNHCEKYWWECINCGNEIIVAQL